MLEEAKIDYQKWQTEAALRDCWKRRTEDAIRGTAKDALRIKCKVDIVIEAEENLSKEKYFEECVKVDKSNDKKNTQT